MNDPVWTELLFAVTDVFLTDTNQRARWRIGDQAPVERRGGAKPRLLVESVGDTGMPAKSIAGTPHTTDIRYDKRILEE